MRLQCQCDIENLLGRVSDEATELERNASVVNKQAEWRSMLLCHTADCSKSSV